MVAVSPQYASKILKAGALLPDTKILLAHWDHSASTTNNLNRARNENLFGKASRSRIEDILRIFHQRYLYDEEVRSALTQLVDNRCSVDTLDTILYFFAATADPLLRDTVTEFLYPRKTNGRDDVYVDDLQSTLNKWVKEGKTDKPWSASTTIRVARGLLATLRDFGILEGANNKTIAPAYLPTPAFSFIAHYLYHKNRSTKQLLEDDSWRLFFLSTDAVERFFLEAHQLGLLDYHAAGPVVRIEFPAKSLKDYADVIASKQI